MFLFRTAHLSKMFPILIHQIIPARFWKWQLIELLFLYLLMIRFYFKNAEYGEEGVHFILITFRKKQHISNMVSVLKHFRRVG